MSITSSEYKPLRKSQSLPHIIASRHDSNVSGITVSTGIGISGSCGILDRIGYNTIACNNHHHHNHNQYELHHHHHHHQYHFHHQHPHFYRNHKKHENVRDKFFLFWFFVCFFFSILYRKLFSGAFSFFDSVGGHLDVAQYETSG